jgi:rubrerythrin
MKMEDHKGMPSGMNLESEKKAVADEMKKTSDEMKKTSEEMKQKSEQKGSQDFYYTCRIHPQIHADKPGKCPICGTTLIEKEGAPPK